MIEDPHHVCVHVWFSCYQSNFLEFKKNIIIVQSSTKVEYRVLPYAATKVLWLKGLFREM